MKRRIILALYLVMTFFGSHADERSGNVDFFLLVDTSLSMAPAIDDVKRYAAGDVVGRLVIPGDWLTILRFYGEQRVVWQGDIVTEADTATAVRSLNDLVADGRFTDIGAALDAMDGLLQARGHTERPKYILLLTDERQEAPKGTKYYSLDYKISHPLLEYVRKEDKGTFRVITIGYGIAARVAGGASSLMTTLSDPPSRPAFPLAGSDAAAMADAAGSGNASGASGPGSSGAAGASSGTASGSGGPNDGSGAAGGLARGGYLGIAAAGLGVVALAGFAIVLIRSRRRKDDDKKAPGKRA